MSTTDWLSTEDVAREIGGVTPRWVRIQIDEGRLRARVLLTGKRATYRVHRPDLEAFRARWILDDARDRRW